MISVILSSIGTMIDNSGMVALFEVTRLQFVLATIASLLGLWTVIKFDGFSREIDENAGMLLAIIATMTLYGFSVAALLLPYSNSYFVEITVIAVIMIFGRWMKRNIGLSNSSSINTSSLIKISENIVKYLIIFTLIMSIGAFVVWVTFSLQGIHMAIEAAAAVLLVACVESPTTVVRKGMSNAMAEAESRGIKFGSENAIEQCAEITTVIFNGIEPLIDRIPRLCELTPVGSLTSPGLLRLAAGLSTAAGMVYAESIMKAAKEEVDIKIPVPEEFTVIEGCGVEGIVETRNILFGNKRLMIERNIDTEPVRDIVERHAAKGNKVFYLASKNKVAGVVAFEFKPHKDAKRLVESIKETGAKAVLITSENQRTADVLAAAIGIDSVYIIVQPAQREEKIVEMKSQGKHVAIAGDQICDGKSINNADLYIKQHYEMPKTGEDKITNGLSSVFLDDHNNDIAAVLKTARSAIHTLKRNILYTVGYNITAVLLAAGVLYAAIGISINPGLAAAISVTYSTAVLRGKRTKKHMVFDG